MGEGFKVLLIGGVGDDEPGRRLVVEMKADDITSTAWHHLYVGRSWRLVWHSCWTKRTWRALIE